MFRAMVWKELRESRGIVLLAVVVYVLVAAGGAVEWNWDKLWDHWTGMAIESPSTSVDPGPFLTDASRQCFWWFSITLSAALGLWQTLGESIHGSWPFLLHRPTSRRWLIGTKLLVGLGLCVACGAAIIVTLGVRSSVPGTYAAPFFWWMTVPWWEILFRMTFVYLAAFLVSLRPARWYGTRLLPLVAVWGLFYVVVDLLDYNLPNPFSWRLAIVLLVDAALIRTIFFVARTRDYA